MDTAARIFVSYSHRDEPWKERVVKHLRVLAPLGLEVWDDRRIAAGDDWQAEIDRAIAECDVALLLVSADFLTSRLILGQEVPPLLQRRQDQGIRVVPLILSPCAWTRIHWLSAIQARPKDGKPLSGMTRHAAESALADLAAEIADLLATVPNPSNLPTARPPGTPPDIDLSHLPAGAPSERRGAFVGRRRLAREARVPGRAGGHLLEPGAEVHVAGADRGGGDEAPGVVMTAKQSAREILIEKLEDLRRYHAICSDGAQRFALKKHIEETEAELKALPDPAQPDGGSAFPSSRMSGIERNDLLALVLRRLTDLDARLGDVADQHLIDEVKRAIAIAQVDGPFALVKTRAILELIVRDIYRRERPDAKPRPLVNMIEELYGTKGLLGRKIAADLHYIRINGNLIVHAQNEPVVVTDSEIEVIIMMVVNLVCWYLTDYLPRARDGSA